MGTFLRLLVLLAALTVLSPGSARAEWLQARSGHFTIYSEDNEKKLRDFAEKLEKFDFLLRHVTGVDDPEAGSPVHVYLLANEAKVKGLARNPDIGGFYTTSDRFAYAVLARGEKDGAFDFGAQEILFHEYTHHFMLHHFPAAYPAWYVEGFAEFFSTVKFPRDGAIEFGHIPVARVPGLVLGSIYPLKELFARDTEGLKRADGDRYYGTAWLLVHYFQYRDSRREEFVHYLNDLAKGVPDMQLDSYFAGGLAGMERDLRAYMRQRLTMSRLAPNVATVGEIAITPVEPARAALVGDELRLMGHPRTDEFPALVASIRQTAAKFPSSAYAMALLAEAERQAEQADAALADADRAIAIDPGLSRAFGTKAQIWLERAQESGKEEDWLAARGAILKANRADMEDPVPLALFYRYHAMRGGPMPEVAYDGLYKAYGLLPQNPDYRLALVHALAAKGDYAAASRLLDPLAYSPHASEGRDMALQLKAQFDAAAKGKGISAAP
ncbi:tetratricopeptide (TPR) repeat protein [Sphingobium wenxiniae]|uniref:Tetratricopeptide repeat protein n=1 Tax=Sphingobium wenxiniae (strain DSM 21828 / CGMCC 1.7748 / JZ-1) TaxID=595605 RepID=A0A562KN42_SPHWJ|nr:hypothetical protein [Sphingobium wenxiniae]MBB6191825.1 tetratricopeptide (TPR) repeat protein [Sphingobium wenxiniae]TWH96858.1 hypothetical protein IQ35_00791 [Sphingobium wenxiniae]